LLEEIRERKFDGFARKIQTAYRRSVHQQPFSRCRWLPHGVAYAFDGCHTCACQLLLFLLASPWFGPRWNNLV
jgi:hypothetical protein